MIWNNFLTAISNIGLFLKPFLICLGILGITYFSITLLGFTKDTALIISIVMLGVIIYKIKCK